MSIFAAPARKQTDGSELLSAPTTPAEIAADLAMVEAEAAEYWDAAQGQDATSEVPSVTEGEEDEEDEGEEDEDEEAIFGRVNVDGDIDLLYKSGERITRLENWSGVYPVGSRLSCAYEHPEGIVLSRENAEDLEIEIEE